MFIIYFISEILLDMPTHETLNDRWTFKHEAQLEIVFYCIQYFLKR